MFDLTVVAQGGRWVLADDAEGELGSYASRAEALEAAGSFAQVDAEPRYVLIQDDDGDWIDAVVEPPSFH